MLQPFGHSRVVCEKQTTTLPRQFDSQPKILYEISGADVMKLARGYLSIP